jgi:hypothetical protein
MDAVLICYFEFHRTKHCGGYQFAYPFNKNAALASTIGGFDHAAPELAIFFTFFFLKSTICFY